MWSLVSFLAVAFVATASGQVVSRDVRFSLTTSRLVTREIFTGQLRGLNINPNEEVKILCHGWMEVVSTFWYRDAQNEYLRRGGSTIISVDWSRHANLGYVTASGRIEAVARFVALLVIDLHDTFNIPFSRMHLVGHSLGAHTMGFVGKHVANMRPGAIIGRISGLDPAGPGYQLATARNRLDSSDASFVDVMYTDAGGYGIRRSIGHVNVHPNGGSAIQNGCLILVCSHNRAPTYWVESINSARFVARECRSNLAYISNLCLLNRRISMGEQVDRTARGEFYLRTRYFSPFARG